MKPSFLQRLPLFISILAVVLTLVAWGRMGAALAANLPYGKALTAQTASGETVRVFCRNSLFVVGETVIQYPCNYRDSSDEIHRDVIGQINLNTASVDLRWELKDDQLAGWIYGLIMSEDGSFTILIDDVKDYFYILGADNSVTRLPDPPNMDQPVSLFYRGKTLEVYSLNADGPIMASYAPDSGWKTQKLPAPDCVDSICRLELAYLEDGNTVLWYTRVPAKPANRENVSVDILRSIGGATPTVAQTETLRPFEYRLSDDGNFSWNAYILDRTRGNSIDAISDAPFSLQGERWVRLALPAIDDKAGFDGLFEYSALRMTLLVSPGKMVRIPRIRARNYPESTFQLNLIRARWIAISANDKGYYLHEIDGVNGPTFLDRRYSLHEFDTDGSTLLPAADGGYWLDLSSVGLIRFNDRLERIDAPGVVDRVMAVFIHPGDVGRGVRNEVILEGTFVKQIGFVFLLLFVPICLIAWGLWKSARREPVLSRSLLWLMALYVVIFVLTFGWFGEVVNAL